MSLKEEIAEKRKEMIVDSYPMSIGEIMNLYKDGELDVILNSKGSIDGMRNKKRNSLNLFYWVFLFLLFLLPKRQMVPGM